MIVALVGQPNCGKSTIFNAVAGYKTATANFPGTTVEFARSAVSCGGERFDVVDLPGIYSLSNASEEERRARDTLLALQPDVVIDVVDASVFSRGIELTVELLDLGSPLVVGLNMMDEAQRKGISIDVAHLQSDLGVPVIPIVASRGEGIRELFSATVGIARDPRRGTIMRMSRDVESSVEQLLSRIDPGTAASVGLPARLIALKLLEQDERVEERVTALDSDLAAEARRLRRQIEQAHGRPSDVVVSSERHAISMNLAEHVASVKRRARGSRRDRLDQFVMHPVWGYLVLALVLSSFFFVVFAFGRLIESPLVAVFGRAGLFLNERLAEGSLLRAVLGGLLQGFSGGVALVLPYLIPFLLGLAVLEDVGYIPRAAFLMDALMHRIGLHGKAVIPFVLGYGCTVPAIMGARIMENARDRYITALLVNFIPCAARTTIVFALIGFFLGPTSALGFYVLTLVVVAAAGRLLLWLHPEASPGLILEIPSYRVPNTRTLLHKVWFRLREFIVVAWPILIIGSLVLSLLEHLGLAGVTNGLLAPLTSSLLGLPPEVGLSLIFGVLRKELTIVMLVQALGTSDFASVLTTEQMCVYTAFALFYVPCLATLAMLRAVIGMRGTLIATALTAGMALVIAMLFRLAFFVLN